MGTVRQYYKKSIQGVLQLKVHKGSVAINVLPGSVTIEVLKEVSQSKVLPGTATIKNTAMDRSNNDRECRNKTYS